MMMNIAYLRCSSDVQDVQHQESSIIDYAKRNNIVIDKIIKDEGVSAYRKDISARTGFLEILDLARKGNVDSLLVFETSRISRQFIESQTIIDELTRCNVKIHSISDNTIINQQEIDQLMIAFRSFMNQKASVETGRRVKSAHELLRQQGKHAAGALPYGYKLIDGYAVIDEELQPQIITMFEDYINYNSKYVQDKYRIKNRKTLIDRISHNAMKQVVGEELWLRANKIRESRKCSPNSSANNLNRTNVLFEGLLYHKCCGAKLHLNRDYRSKNNPHSYRCKTCRGNNNISNKKSFSGAKLDSYLEEQILDILNNLNHDALVDKYASRCTKKQAVLQLKLNECTNTHSTKKRALQLAQTKLETYILNGSPDATINAISKMIESVESELSELEQQLTILNNELDAIQEQAAYQEALIADILNACEIYKSASIVQKKAILNMLISRIEVTDINNADIYLNI
jgi:DNA invertase Pin-like site-specific DNA recombinase